MTFVQTLGSAVKGSSTLTTVRTLTVNTTVGNTVIVSWEAATSATALSVTCADSKGNTYTPLTSQTSSSGLYTAVFSAPVTTQLVSGDTITVTQGGTATANGAIFCHEHSNLGAPIVVNGNTVASGATSATSGSVTLAAAGTVVAILHTSTGSSTTTSATLGAPWNARETGQTGTTTVHWAGVWDQAVAASTVTAGPTLSQTAVSVGYAMSIVGFTATSSTVTGAASLTGAAAVTAGSVVAVPAGASLTGSAALTAGAAVAVPAAASLAAAAALSASAVVVVPATASLTGAAALTASAKVVVVGSATLTGGATLTAASVVVVIGTASLVSATSLTAVGGLPSAPKSAPYLDASIASRTAEGSLTARQADATLTGRTLNAGIATRPLGATASTRILEATLT